jgi:hypothetical protein
MNKNIYLDDYSMEDIIDLLKFVKNNEDNNDIDIDNNDNDKEENIENKPSFSMKPNFNSKGEKVVVFSINIPIKKNGLKIDILINDEMYKNIGKQFKS